MLPDSNSNDGTTEEVVSAVDAAAAAAAAAADGCRLEQQQHQRQEPPTKVSWSGMARSAVNRFASATSAHGYRNLVSSASQPLCLTIWLLFIAGALGGLTFHLNLIATQYFAYGKRVLTYKTVEALRFPTVLLCTTNFWSDLLINQPDNREIKDLRDSMLNRSAILFPNGAHFQQELFVDQMLLENYFGAKRRADTSFVDLLQVTTSLNSVLLACQFNFLPCSAANFTPVATQEYGFCFSFRPELPLGSQYGSYNNGLMLTLALEGSTSSSRFANEPSLTFTKGYVVKLVAHDFYPNTYRLPPFGAPVSFHTGIALTSARTLRLQSWASPCSNSQVVFDSFDIDGSDAVEYSHSLVTCVDMQLSKHIYNNCGCVTSYLAVPMELADRAHCLEVANVSSGEDIVAAYQRHQCALQELHSHSETSAYSTFISQCLPSCLDMDVRVSTSRTLLPSMRSWSDDLLDLIKNRSVSLTASGEANYLSQLYNMSLSTDDSSYLVNHVCQLNIFFTGSTLDTFEEDWQYPIESFLSEAGGVIGLWTGASVLTVIEFMELFGRLTKIFCYNFRRLLNEQHRPEPQSRELSGAQETGGSPGAVVRRTNCTKETEI